MGRVWVSGVSAWAIACALSWTVTEAGAAGLYDREESIKDGGTIYVPAPQWSGFYIGAHVGGGWSDDERRNLTVSGGAGGGGGGGGGDNNWYKGNHKPRNDAIDGGDGKSGDAGGKGGTGGNTGQSKAPTAGIGGDGGDGGKGGSVSGGAGDGNPLIAGIHLGYNWQRGSLLLGIEGDASFNDSLEDYLASLRARVGIVRNNALFYVTGGIAFRDGDSAGAYALAGAGGKGGDGGANDDDPKFGDNPSEKDELTKFGGFGGHGGPGGTGAPSGYVSASHGSDTGYVLGGGVEFKLSHNVSAGLEGLWYSFDGDDDLTVLRARLTMHLRRAEQVSYKDGFVTAPVANWAGLYFGANIGAAFRDGETANSVTAEHGHPGAKGADGAKGRSDGKDDGHDDAGGGGGGGGGGAAALVSFDQSSLIGGVHLGYNWQDGARIIGIEGDANWGDDTFQDYLASVRLRIGYAFDQLLIYGTAGIAFSGSSGSYSVALTAAGDGKTGGAGCFENVGTTVPNPKCPSNPLGGGFGGAGGDAGKAIVTSSGGSDEIGFVIGGGFEVKLRENVSLGVEGLYFGFDGDSGKTGAASYASSDDPSGFAVRGRLTYHLQERRDPLK